MRYMYTVEYMYIYLYKKGQNNAICSNMDAARDYHTKWSKSERERSQKVSQKDSIKASHTKWSKSERQIPYDIT